jgi:CubicO group peptidase (beta-lactamase class C family)
MKDPVLRQYQTARGVTPTFGGSRSLVESYDYPLLFEPGESWEYSVGIDWAGEMVTRVSNLSLEDYMKKNIWGPLGMNHITFFPKKDPEVMSRLADMSERDCPVTMFGTAEDPNAKLKYTDNTIWAIESVACHGGAGGYGSPLDYHKMLYSICADDGKLLKSATIDEMFKPQLTDAARAKMQELIEIPAMNQVYGGYPGGIKVDWGIGGIMNLNALPGRSAGSIAWGGYPNLLWYIDRRAGMSGIMGTQINPPGDMKVSSLMNEWIVACYKEAGVEAKEKL